MDPNERLTRKWFDDRHQDYQEHIVEGQPNLYRTVGPILARAIEGRTLIAGSGPLLPAAAQKSKSMVCLDLAAAPLRLLDQPTGGGKVQAVCGDAAALPFPSGLFDTVVFPFIFHHVAQKSVSATTQKVETILGEAARVVKPTGTVVVLDLFLNRIFQTVQRTFYAPARAFLNAIGQPMMLFQSSLTLGHPRLVRQNDERIPLPDKIVPTLLLPKLQMDGKYHPAEIHLLTFKVQ